MWSGSGKVPTPLYNNRAEGSYAIVQQSGWRRKHLVPGRVGSRRPSPTQGGLYWWFDGWFWAMFKQGFDDFSRIEERLVLSGPLTVLFPNFCFNLWLFLDPFQFWLSLDCCFTFFKVLWLELVALFWVFLSDRQETHGHGQSILLDLE